MCPKIKRLEVLTNSELSPSFQGHKSDRFSKCFKQQLERWWRLSHRSESPVVKGSSASYLAFSQTNTWKFKQVNTDKCSTLKSS